MSALNTFDGKHLLLGAILALGALVRLSGLDVGWFLQDQARDGMAAQGILSGQDFPLVGPHAALSTVQLVGPLYYYLVAIPYGLSTNPVAGVAFLNLLGVLSIYLTYRLGKEMFGSLEGLIAAALYAVFPMAVLSGKALWNPGFIPFFSTLFLLTLWRFLVGAPSLGFSTCTVPPWRSSADPHEWRDLRAAAPNSIPSVSPSASALASGNGPSQRCSPLCSICHL